MSHHAVYKYQFDVRDRQTIELPTGAKILHVEIQGGVPCLWALVDIKAVYEQRTFRIFGTERPVADPEELTFVATFFVNGVLVFHMFEEKR